MILDNNILKCSKCCFCNCLLINWLQVDDPRLRRLRMAGHSPQRRAEHKPEIIDEEPEQESESSPEEAKDSSESEDELDEDEIERRRQALRAKLAAR